MDKRKLLFVDDEPNIRITLPLILAQRGFEVKTAASVPEALDLINKERFDLLISDLNIGQPGDVFTVVSVMRRVQPEAVTFILTGYPDFDSALRAIRSQVDDYLVKPADIPTLVAALEYKLANRRPLRFLPTRRAPELLLDNLGEIFQRWLKSISEHPELKKMRVSTKERFDLMTEILTGICGHVIKGQDTLDETTSAFALEHGVSRFKLGYRADFIITETRILQQVISRFFQENILAVDLSSLIPDVMHTAEMISMATEQSLRSFHEQVEAA
jgi:ActR/RegA family two-component response regulator